MLPKQYLNFSDVFDNIQVDILLQHNQHNLAIKLESDKQSLFDLIYNLSKSKFDVLCEYINKILAKGFIILFKSFLRAFVLFINKKSGGLHLYIDYFGLNTIIKK